MKKYHIHGPRGIQSQEADGGWQHMLQDGLDSVRGVVDDALTIQQSTHYDPFGNPMAVVGSEQTLYGYSGEPTDANGLVHVRGRYYNPATGTYVSQDSLEGMPDTPMSLNRYAFGQGGRHDEA